MQTAEELKETEVQDRFHEALVAWSGRYHDTLIGILAPKGFKSNGEHQVTTLAFLTEERIKKAANLSHNVLKEFKKSLLTTMAKEYLSIVRERDDITKRLNEEKARKWWSQDKRLIMAWTLELTECNFQLKAFNGIESMVHSVKPKE